MEPKPFQNPPPQSPWMLILLVILSAISASAESADPVACPVAFGNLETKQTNAAAEKLEKKGYNEEIAARIAKENPEMATKLSRSVNGDPFVPNDKTTKYVYRGFRFDPSHYNPRGTSPDFGNTMFVGTEADAMQYSNKGSLISSAPLPGRKKNFTLIVEMQLPKLGILSNDGQYITYSRAKIPDESLFIRRVGLKDWSLAKVIPCASGTDTCYDVPITWYKYEDVFDATGKFKARPDW